MSISTQSSRTSALKSPLLGRSILHTTALLLPVFGIVLVSWPGTLKRRKNRFLLVMIVLVLPLLSSCSGLSSPGGTGGTTSPPNPPVTYQITVTGSSAGTPASSGHSVVVSLVVN